DRTIVPSAMKLLQQPERVRDGHQVLDGLADQRELAAAVAPELLRDAKRMKSAEPVPEFEQQLVVNGEQRSFQRRKHRQLVVRPLDRGERRADGLDFFATVKGLAADEEVRNPARLDCVRVSPRDIFAEADESSEENGDIPRQKAPAVFRLDQPL